MGRFFESDLRPQGLKLSWFLENLAFGQKNFLQFGEVDLVDSFFVAVS